MRQHYSVYYIKRSWFQMGSQYTVARFPSSIKFALLFTDCRLGDYLRLTGLGIQLGDADISVDCLIFFILFQHYCLPISNQIRISILKRYLKRFYQYKMDRCSERNRLNVPADHSHETVVIGPGKTEAHWQIVGPYTSTLRSIHPSAAFTSPFILNVFDLNLRSFRSRLYMLGPILVPATSQWVRNNQYSVLETTLVEYCLCN